ncbi:MAG TPA: MarR family transcriptional regulator [Kiloniellales bacterium]|nr:MarR family transcriptional regulator [Kiloniellales bacterium]
MADVKTGPNPLFLREEELRQAMEMLFFAYRDFTAEPDQILAPMGFGRAHHRVVYFVGRHPGITVSELLKILAITKQSLSRVLGQLVAEGYVRQQPGRRDRRQRLLELTDKGWALERQLSESQRARIANAYRQAGADAVEGFRKVLLNIIDEKNRGRFLADERSGRPGPRTGGQAERPQGAAGPGVPTPRPSGVRAALRR